MYMKDKINNGVVAIVFQVARQYPLRLKCIDLKPFLIGHTHRECDTYHSATECSVLCVNRFEP
jgi:hypothetical protein